MIFTYPVGIWQVNTNGCGRIAIASQLGSSNYLSSNPFNFLLFKAFIDWRMIFEPLGVGTKQLSAVCSFHILEVNNRFPGSFPAERVLIVLNKAIHKVYARIEIFHPNNIIIVPGFKASGFIVFNQFNYFSFLSFIFSNSNSLFQPFYNLSNSGSVHSIQFIYLFYNL